MTPAARLASAELDRKVEQSMRVGVVTALDAGAGLVRCAVGALTTGWLPWLTLRAGPDRSWWAPEPGEQVLILTPAGRGAQAVALPALFSDAAPAPGDRPDVHRTVYADGAVIEYDRAAHALSATLPGGATARLVAPGGVSIVGDVSVEGAITATGDVVGAGVSLETHVHGGVVVGLARTLEPVK